MDLYDTPGTQRDKLFTFTTTPLPHPFTKPKLLYLPQGLFTSSYVGWLSLYWLPCCWVTGCFPLGGWVLMGGVFLVGVLFGAVG
jgi:hypothetical protein